MKIIALLFTFFLAMAPLQAKQWKGKWITSEYSQSLESGKHQVSVSFQK